MKNDMLPSWQRVLLTALEHIPWAKDGPDAWARLSAEEQAAVMDFLAEQTGGKDVQCALEDTLARAEVQRTLLVVVKILLYMAVLLGVGWGLIRQGLPGDLLLWIFIGVSHVILAIMGARRKRMERIWREREKTGYGTQLALRDMRRTLDMPLWDVADRFEIIFYGAFLIVFIVLLCLKTIR